ncbi:uncharacterized protein LOC116117637 [Pistacia vera]|uniref:uncharacterized protein LOC116117637 n=1 Tax=Pistacia vera TaxID=55513 RepID=UPI001263A19A|nr:uncharacterized protein LOC116117637 [Pistacia vera]
MSRYVCCAGYMPCSGKCYESSCTELCLGTEGFMLCLQQVACIFSMVACIVGSDELREASQILNLLADLVYCTVCACRQVCNYAIDSLLYMSLCPTDLLRSSFSQ